MSERSKKLHSVTREDLYAQVWQTPMSRLAKTFGISGNGLAKICKRLEVPVPPHGYWARKAAGQPVIQYRLQEPAENTLREVEISPTLPATEAPPEATRKIREAKESIDKVAVPARLRDPHPIIARWIEERDERLREASKERDPWQHKRFAIHRFSEIERRRHRILDTIFKEAAKHGIEAKRPDYRRLLLIDGNEEIEIQLRERLRQIRIPLPPGEDPWNKKRWRAELKPSGVLTFEIKTWIGPGIKKSWVDKGLKKLEDMVPEILSSIVAAGPALAEMRRQREEEQRRWAEAQRRRHEAEQARRRDENRWGRFLELAQARRDARLARELLKEIEGRPFDPEATIGGQTVSEWFDWMRKHIADHDPTVWAVADVVSDIASIGPDKNNESAEPMGWHWTL